MSLGYFKACEPTNTDTREHYSNSGIQPTQAFGRQHWFGETETNTAYNKYLGRWLFEAGAYIVW